MIQINHLISGTDPEFPWIVRVIAIKENKMTVKISSETTYQWKTIWSLEDTESKIEQKIYYIMGKWHD